MDNSKAMDNEQVNITVNKSGRVLHFSDGVDEEIEEITAAEVHNSPNTEDNVDPVSFPFQAIATSFNASLVNCKILIPIQFQMTTVAVNNITNLKCDCYLGFSRNALIFFHKSLLPDTI